MKIAYIISDINKAVFFENTALALREYGIDVCYIVINYENGALVSFLRENNFKLYTIKSGKLSQSWPQIRQVRKILKAEQPDIVHCHLAQANWIGLWAAYLNKVRMRIYTRHSGEPLKLLWKERVIDWVQNRLATKIVSISQVIDDLLEQQNVPAYKREVIHHGFELERFVQHDAKEIQRIQDDYNPDRNYPVIGVIARWMKWKGIQDIIEGFLILLETHPDALLCLFGATGAGDYHEALASLLHKIPSRNVRIVPFENNVFDLYQLFDVYVHTPVNPTCEAFGQTYVEALAAGVPSVFTASGIAQEFIVDKKHALIVPFNNPNAIADAITELLNNKPLAEKLKENGQRIVFERFTFNVYSQRLLEFYQSGSPALKKKKLIYVISDVNRAVYFEQTAIALRNLKYDPIFVLISCKNSPLDHFLKANNFKRYHLEVNKLSYSIGAIRKLRRFLRYEKPDLVHCHLFKANWVGLNAAKFAKVKNRLYTRHSGAPLHPNKKERVIDFIQNRLATHIIAISENISTLLDQQGIPATKKTLIHHGFDLQRFKNNDTEEVHRMLDMYNPERRGPVIGVISRWMELKGMDYIIAAFEQILTTHPNALLCLFGEKDDSDYSRKLLSKLKHIPPQNLSMIDFENNCFDLYRLFDVYVHVPVNPTCEAFGQTYVEALAAGVPSVFTLSGVAGEFIVDRKNALVVPFKDDQAIYQAILRLLTEPELRERLIENGKKSVQSFNFETYIDQLINVYNL